MSDRTPAAASDDLRDCLPVAFQSPATLITRIAAGMSGAGVYRVDAGDEHFVLKITASDEPLAAWQRSLEVQHSAAAVGIAPQILHVDASRRAVVSAMIADRNFAAEFGSPVTRAAAVEALGQMLARLHALPIPQNAVTAEPRPALGVVWGAVPQDFVVPAFVRQAVAELLAEVTPACPEAPVMSHNDVNPSNIVFDGDRVMLLDWQAAAPNHAHYDLATIAMFYRFDDDTCRQMIAAHNHAPVDVIPATFRYFRRVAATLSGAFALNAARMRGHAGSAVAIELTPSLNDLYAQLRGGTFNLGSANGQWVFGLALVKEGVTLGS